MKLRVAVVLLALLALGTREGARAEASDSPEAPRREADVSSSIVASAWRRDAERPPVSPVRWSFRTASPMVAAPSLCNDRLYVPTAEGAVHALQTDGRFLWSYNVQSGVSGRMACDKTGNVYVGTTVSKLYSLNPQGTLGWVRQLPIGAVTNLVWSSRRFVFFGGEDGRVWAASSRSGLLWRSDAEMPSPSDLVLDEITTPQWAGRGVVLGSGGAVWWVRGVAQTQQRQIGRELMFAPLSTVGGVYAVSDRGLFAFEADGSPRWNQAGITGVAASGGHLVATRRGQLCDINAADGSKRRCTDLPEQFTGAPVMAGAAVVVAGERVLFAVWEDGLQAELALPGSVARLPVYDAATDQLLVTTGSNQLHGLSVGLWRDQAQQVREGLGGGELEGGLSGPQD